MFNRKYIDSIRGPHFPASELLDDPGVYVTLKGLEAMYLEDHPGGFVSFITMVIVNPLRIGLFPFQMAYING